MNILDLMGWVKPALIADSNVTYNETVIIQEYKPETLPEFDIYCIVISPVSDGDKLISNGMKERTCKLEINCVVRNFNEDVSLLGSGNIAGEAGVIKFVDDVRKALFNFGEANRDKVTILYDEMEEPVNYKKMVQIPDREGFFREVVIPYSVRLEREYL